MDTIQKLFMLQAEIDCLIWQLEEMLRKEKMLTPIEIMIDKSTGYDKKKLKNAELIIKRIKKLQKEYLDLQDKALSGACTERVTSDHKDRRPSR